MTIKAAMVLQKITKKKLSLGGFLWSIRMCDEKSQIRFEKELDISNQYLCDIECGRRMVSPGTAKKFAEKLGYLPEQFVELAIQDMLNHEKIKMKVHVEKAA